MRYFSILEKYQIFVLKICSRQVKYIKKLLSLTLRKSCMKLTKAFALFQFGSFFDLLIGDREYALRFDVLVRDVSL